MDSLISARRCSLNIICQPAIHSPMPIRKRKSVFLTPVLRRGTILNLNENDDVDTYKPSQFLLNKFRKITGEIKDDYDYECDTCTEATMNKSLSSDDSREERRLITEDSDSIISSDTPVSRANNPQALDQEFHDDENSVSFEGLSKLVIKD